MESIQGMSDKELIKAYEEEYMLAKGSSIDETTRSWLNKAAKELSKRGYTVVPGWTINREKRNK